MYIFQEIREEREKQDKEYGGVAHDDKHTNHDWIAYITKHLGLALTWPFELSTFRYQLIRVAALCVAAIEWADRLKEDAPPIPNKANPLQKVDDLIKFIVLKSNKMLPHFYESLVCNALEARDELASEKGNPDNSTQQ